MFRVPGSGFKVQSSEFRVHVLWNVASCILMLEIELLMLNSEPGTRNPEP